MSEKKNISLLNFFRKNLYYFMIGASLIIIATVIAIVLANDTSNATGGIKESIKPIESIKESERDSQPESEKEPENENESSKPTDTKIIFTLPVSSGTVIKSYTSSTVVFNQTLGVVSDNNRQEYKDGPHLHFEVILNGERVNPTDYLMMNEK